MCIRDRGYTCTQYSFSDSNDLAAVAATAAGESDVIYVPTDNTVASNTEIIRNICEPEGVPVIAGEEGICGGCGVATLSISYYDLGVATGNMAVKVLTGESDISEMPIEYAPEFTKKYNPEDVYKRQRGSMPARSWKPALKGWPDTCRICRACQWFRWG